MEMQHLPRAGWYMYMCSRAVGMCNRPGAVGTCAAGPVEYTNGPVARPYLGFRSLFEHLHKPKLGLDTDTQRISLTLLRSLPG